MKRKIILILIIFLILASGCVSEEPQTCKDAVAEIPQLIADAQDYPTAQVQRIVDGDTLVLTNGKKVRLIGIDTPEKSYEYYSEAGDYLGSLTLNKTLYLEQDVSETGKYGRYLYYLYTDDLFVNAEMVSSGYAESYPYEPDTKHSFLFDCLETHAKEKNLVIWTS
ncbi:hypothetical protein GF374_01855 [Candidatus Woesearchaeota archaeon]|nr:hypothetical protein [Candidatus Woesearchaeota archaeon]